MKTTLLKNCLAILMTLLAAGMTYGQTAGNTFDDIYRQIDRSNFFRAAELYETSHEGLTTTQRLFTEACLDNAFNRLESSQKKINTLLAARTGLPDSLRIKLYMLREDNAVKLQDYRQAERTLETIMADYGEAFPPEAIAGMENNLKIWTALKNVPRQKVTIPNTVTLPIRKDKGNLNTLPITFPTGRQVDFVFDTGANISTIGRSMAESLGMRIIPADISVGTVTGDAVSAQLAVCRSMRLGDIRIRNAVFLVLDDSALSFPQIGYEIHGIIGYPVMAALREIQLTADCKLTVPKDETLTAYPSNMAMDGFTPLISIDGRHYTFDTGARTSILYNAYYEENRDETDARYAPDKVSFAGAAGAKEFDGYNVTIELDIMDKTATLDDIPLLREKITPTETVYGNLGQDLIGRFDKMTINFDRMFIRFD